MPKPSNHLDLLESLLPIEQQEDFRKYTLDLLEKDQWYSIDPEFLGFLEDYQDYASIIQRHIWVDPLTKVPREYTIYDVGCATALQHIFFDKCPGYVGIDYPGPPTPRFFRPNCKFVEGRFSDVVGTLGIDPNKSIGIANMSLLYRGGGPKDLEAFDQAFKRKFIF